MSRGYALRRARGQRGMALIVVLGLLTIMIGIAAIAMSRIRQVQVGAGRVQLTIEAELIARSGVELLRARLSPGSPAPPAPPPEGPPEQAPEALAPPPLRPLVRIPLPPDPLLPGSGPAGERALLIQTDRLGSGRLQVLAVPCGPGLLVSSEGHVPDSARARAGWRVVSWFAGPGDVELESRPVGRAP